LQISHRLVPVHGAPTSLSPNGAKLKGLTPGCDRRFVFEHFRYPQSGPRGRLGRQRASLEEAAGDDLAIGFGQAILAEMPDQIDRDVVPAGNVAVEEQAMQGRCAPQFNPPLLREFAPWGIEEGFADL